MPSISEKPLHFCNFRIGEIFTLVAAQRHGPFTALGVPGGLELARAAHRSFSQRAARARNAAMPHDGTPRNGRMHEFGVPGWVIALALALAFSAAIAVLAAATGAFVILLPALAVAALGYGLYLAIAARRRARFFDGLPRGMSVIQDGRGLRRRWRLGDTP
jgi:hypothetical protein